jgi:hypothetical protein
MNAGVMIGDCGWRNSHETLKIDERWSGDWGLLTEAASRSKPVFDRSFAHSLKDPMAPTDPQTPT